MIYLTVFLLIITLGVVIYLERIRKKEREDGFLNFKMQMHDQLTTVTHKIHKIELENIKPKFKKGDKISYYALMGCRPGEYISREMDLDKNEWVCLILVKKGVVNISESCVYEEMQT